MAIIEHPRHVGDVLRVEVRHIKRIQTRATEEHLSHVSYVLGVEVRQVKRSQNTAPPEHPTHVSDVLGVEIFQPFNLLEPIIFVEPLGGRGGTEISERGIEHHTSGGTFCICRCPCPCWEGVISRFFCLLDAPSSAGTSGTQGIVVEGEGRLVRALRHIGLAGLRLRTLRSGEQETNQCEAHRTAIT